MKNKQVSVILPVHDVSGDFDVWFKKAIKSVVQSVVKPNNLMVVCADNKDVKAYMDSWEKPEDLSVSILYNSDKTDYCGQVNFGVDKCETEYFSILEFDDEYSNIWFKNFDEYVNHYPDVDIFLPLVVDTDEQGQFVGFTNEALWAMGFSEEQGYLDNNTLLKFQNFQVSGLIMNKDKFEEIGGLKSSMRLTFNYEFLLRATYNDTTIMTIPKVGYKHTNQRTNSLFWDYKYSNNSLLSQEEAKFWVDTAKKEYFFTSDREVSFNS
ncbi:hypothetical protein N9322_01360 [bacterium]|jgi:hypothetical protein|nr:hypothetical protein [bacterium]|tara:strand:+ start:2102 stop:2899 length:798 start_codon:yes stop_codon:yes gene_type:complete